MSFRETALAQHPIEAVQAHQLANEWETSLRLSAMAHGQAAAIEKRLDRAALSQIRRLPGGPPSSHALLDGYLGRDASVGVEDFLNGARQGRLALHFSFCHLPLTHPLSLLCPPPPPRPLRAVPELRSNFPSAAGDFVADPK